LLIGLAGGLLGGLIGLGGGIILVPALSGIVGLPLPEAVGTSLISISATSISATVSYVRQGLTEPELGVRLVALTSFGALAGGFIGLTAGARVIAILFAALAVYTAVYLVRRNWAPAAESGQPARPWLAYPLMLVSGALSGLLGIGGGPVNVPVMQVLLGLPLRRAAATSSFMVGVTAATGAVLYLAHGRLQLPTVGVSVIGVAVGAQVAALLQRRVPTRALALIFAAVLLAVAVQMLVNQ
jgi:uncharacterized membrane protein YfcA